jgi:hypothetical protein
VVGHCVWIIEIEKKFVSERLAEYFWLWLKTVWIFRSREFWESWIVLRCRISGLEGNQGGFGLGGGGKIGVGGSSGFRTRKPCIWREISIRLSPQTLRGSKGASFPG